MERNCGKCHLCCKLMIIPELGKRDNVWCEHCEIGRGCKIYADRPQLCRDFFCYYIENHTMDDRWNPARAHFLLRSDDNRMVVQVDPQRPDAWKHEPYHAALRKHARTAYPRGAQIFVKIGDQAIAILPDRDVDLGIVTGTDRVGCTPEFTPTGVRWNAMKIAKAP